MTSITKLLTLQMQKLGCFIALEWEGVESGTRSAAVGGVTTVVDMPLNSIPSTVDVKSFEAKLRAVRKPRGKNICRYCVLGRTRATKRTQRDGFGRIIVERCRRLEGIYVARRNGGFRSKLCKRYQGGRGDFNEIQRSVNGSRGITSSERCFILER